MTRILVLSNFFPPHSHGGYELSCADVMGRLADRGHEITVLTSRYHRPDLADLADGDIGTDGGGAGAGVRVVRTLDLYWDHHRLVVPPRRRRVVMEWHNQRALRRVIQEARPEVVSVWNMGAMSMGLLTTLVRRRTRLVYAVCNDWLVWGPDMDAWHTGWQDHPAWAADVATATGLPTHMTDLGTSGTFLFVSEWTRRWAEEHSRWQFPDSSVVYSGIDPADFPVGPAAAGGGSEGGDEDRPWRWKLLFVGRLEADKGVDTAVRALAHLPDQATLEIVGPGSAEERSRVEAAARDAGVSERVSFADLPRAQLAPRYRDADVFVFPSRWEEPFGLVPVEAMACRTPVVATRTGGSAEFLLDGVNCLGFPREDPAALARTVQRLFADPTLRRRLVHNGAATAAELTVDRLADTFEQWLTAAAAGFPDGRPEPRRLHIPDPEPGPP